MTSRVAVGIYVHEAPQRLLATIASVREHTALPVELLLLPDGADTATSRAIETLKDIPQSATIEPRGTAACFNRLAAVSSADTLVLLESGSIVGARWLEHLLAALDADTRNGLAGPTTNLSLERTSGLSQRRRERDEIAQRRDAPRAVRLDDADPRAALQPRRLLLRRAPRRDRRRSAPADEGYGLGSVLGDGLQHPRRPRRLRGVWACGGIRASVAVHRAAARGGGAPLRSQPAPLSGQVLRRPPPRREERLPDALPRRRLCEFRSAVADRDPTRAGRADAGVRPQPAGDCRASGGAATPLVSCIMPTCDRRRFVPQAIALLPRAGLPAPRARRRRRRRRCDRATACRDDPRIRYVCADRQAPTIGAKRNVACAHARGDVIVHWDDDDWYPPSRVTRQVRALIERWHRSLRQQPRAVFRSGTRSERGSTATAQPALDGSRATRSPTAERSGSSIGFADVQVGEDAQFIWNCRGARISDLADPRALRRDRASQATPAARTRRARSGTCTVSPTSPRSSARTSVRIALRRAAARRRRGRSYRASCRLTTDGRLSPSPSSCSSTRITPIASLIVVDDGDDAVGDLCQGVPRVRYFRLPKRLSIGAKRNLACEHAAGDIVAHWDDDDWYARNRLRYQVAAILAGEADITGLENAFVLDVPRWPVLGDAARPASPDVRRRRARRDAGVPPSALARWAPLSRRQPR